VAAAGNAIGGHFDDGAECSSSEALAGAVSARLMSRLHKLGTVLSCQRIAKMYSNFHPRALTLMLAIIIILEYSCAF
jgi:hypothetical protein